MTLLQARTQKDVGSNTPRVCGGEGNEGMGAGRRLRGRGVYGTGRCFWFLVCALLLVYIVVWAVFMQFAVDVDMYDSHSFSGAMREELKMWDRAAAQREILQRHFAGTPPGEEALGESLRGKLEAIPQCRALGSPFLDYLQKYLLVHYYDPSDADDGPRLIYSCESPKKGHYCAGVGDRFSGIITSFWSALLSRRKFEVYHPSPVPMQKFFPPYLVNYIPSIRMNFSELQSKMHQFTPETFRYSLSSFITTAPINRYLFSRTMYRAYVLLQKDANRWVPEKPPIGSREWWRPHYATRDIRVESNSQGIDDFLSEDPELYDVKVRLLGLKDCSKWCYFGCLSHILFQPDMRLWNATVEVLRTSQAEPVLASVAGAREATPGQVLPFISLQVRMGGSWAPQIGEKFRTSPELLPHLYSMVRDVVSGDAWRRHPELFPEDYHMRDVFKTNGSVVLFVSSDSPRLVKEVKHTVKGYRGVRVITTSGDSFQHTEKLYHRGSLASKGHKTAESARENAYFLTLLNHYLLSLASHSILTKSNFGFTAFLRSRQMGSGIYCDEPNSPLLWHHFRYPEAADDAPWPVKCLNGSFVEDVLALSKPVSP